MAVQADICPRCGEHYFDLETMRKLEAADQLDLSRRSNNKKLSSPSPHSGSKNRTTDRARLQTCIMCGSKQVGRRTVTVTRQSGTRVRVRADVCPDCGERYYDSEAMRRLEAADPRDKRKRLLVRKIASES